MSSRVPAKLRRRVRLRASGVCEYCLVREADSPFDHQIEHVISRKHGGRTTIGNLALSCPFCNRFKGSDIATLIVGTNQLVRLYNPRTQVWAEHFHLVGARVVGHTDVGRATAGLLCVNLFRRLQERDQLVAAGQYPSPEAMRVAGLL